MRSGAEPETDRTVAEGAAMPAEVDRRTYQLVHKMPPLAADGVMDGPSPGCGRLPGALPARSVFGSWEEQLGYLPTPSPCPFTDGLAPAGN